MVICKRTGKVKSSVINATAKPIIKCPNIVYLLYLYIARKIPTFMVTVHVYGRIYLCRFRNVGGVNFLPPLSGNSGGCVGIVLDI